MTPLCTPGQARQPRWRLLLNGTVVAGCISCEVESNSHYQADTWRAEMALNPPGGTTPAQWGSLTLDQWGGDALVGALFVVQARLQPSDPWTSLITGEADKLAIDVPHGTVSLSGRDLTGELIEGKLQETFLNKTSSEVAIYLAGRHRHLKTVDANGQPTITPTTTLVSRYYQQDHDRVSHDQFSRAGTEWDLLAFLAQQEDFDLFVSGTALYFQPAQTGAAGYSVTWNPQTRTGDVVGLTLERSLTLAKDVQVTVRSWNSRQGRAFTRKSGTAGKGSMAQTYAYTRPNLTEDQAQKLADSLREQITRHERTASLTLPVEVALTPRDPIALQGVGASWEQTYFVASISRQFREEGTMERVQVKNASPESDALAPS